MLSTSSDRTQSQSLVDGNTTFALNLYRHLKANPGNLFFSPYSISTALAVTYAGARGETEKQMAHVLHFDKNQQQHSSFGNLHRQHKEIGEQPGVQLSIANALWTQTGYPFLPGFLKIAKDEYQANAGQADFANVGEAVRHEINCWAAHQTKDKIKDILPPGSITDLTRMVLANAIYFKEGWASPFDKAKTSVQAFHISTASRVDVPLMRHVEEVGFMENSDFQAVELPYESNRLSMVILLPRKVDGFGELENRLSRTSLTDSLSQMRKQKVEIFLPRFKLESAFDLPDTLSAMGMTDAFIEEKADFSGIDGTRLLFISGAFHKTLLEVNEEGTEAAAMMAVLYRMRGVTHSAPPVFRADHPFIFLIRDVSSGSLLFLGRLTDP